MEIPPPPPYKIFYGCTYEREPSSIQNTKWGKKGVAHPEEILPQRSFHIKYSKKKYISVAEATLQSTFFLCTYITNNIISGLIHLYYQWLTIILCFTNLILKGKITWGKSDNNNVQCGMHTQGYLLCIHRFRNYWPFFLNDFVSFFVLMDAFRIFKKYACMRYHLYVYKR